jgi:hypothetical protein
MTAEDGELYSSPPQDAEPGLPNQDTPKLSLRVLLSLAKGTADLCRICKQTCAQHD